VASMAMLNSATSVFIFATTLRIVGNAARRVWLSAATPCDETRDSAA